MSRIAVTGQKRVPSYMEISEGFGEYVINRNIFKESDNSVVSVLTRTAAGNKK
jgi:hypothetical protein